MKKTDIAARLRCGTAPLIVAAALLSPSVSMAQEAADGANEPVIVVTGSRISSPNDASIVPITTVSGAELFETGKVSVGDTLNELPQLRPTFSQANSTRYLGTRGLNLLDLRGLGTQRTLVLVNGRRHVASDILSNGVSTDINTIPTDLIDSIDIVTGGNSSIYGSDAVAGVVNFILKKDYEGIQIRGQNGISKYGDAGNQYVSLLAGKNFADGRGNIAFNFEFSNQSDYYASDRPAIARNNGFVVVDSDPAGTPNGSDGVYDRLFYKDIRSATISSGGLINLYQPRGAAGCGLDGLGNPYNCTWLFQSDGSLVQQTGDRIGLAPNGNYVGGNGASNREGQLLALSPNLKRYSFNMIGQFEVSPAFVPFFEAKYVRTDAFGSQSGPMFAQGSTLGDPDPANRERIRLDNPYLSDQARTLLTEQVTSIVNSGVNPNNGAGLDAAGQASILSQVADGSYRVRLLRNWVDLGMRDERMRRETYRFVGGFRGNFNDDWNYEVSANYGEYKERNLIQSNINLQRYLLAMDTARDSSGNIVCRSQLDPASTIGYIDQGATLANDIARCVPLNPFGNGSVSKEAREYLTMSSLATGKITQFVASGYVSGNSSKWFELPGGPVGFSIGAEYRRETNRYDLDDLTQAGYGFYNAIPSFTAPAFEVKEVFGELRIPILKDVPFFHELTLTGSGRLADYKGATGTVFAYSGGVDWAPVRDLRFRGSYSRSVRAPNLQEMYQEQGQNYAAAPLDPCSERNIGAGSQYRAANCAAAGRPAGYDYVYTSSIEIVSGGNPGLEEEKSTSWTVGGVLTPTFVPGLRVSVDYYNIKVDNVISSISAQDILNLCYDMPSLDNSFCGLFQRAGAGGGSQGEIPFQVLEGSLLQSSANFAKYTAKGIDTNVAYNHSFGWGDLSLGVVWTRTLNRNEYTNPSEPNYVNVLLGELADPKNRVNFNANVKFGKFAIGYQGRFIDKMYLNTYEDYNSVNGQPPQNADYASVRQYPTVTYHDIRMSLDVTDKSQLYLGVDNVGNKMPPYGLTGIGGGSGIYDVRGRYFYLGVKAGF